MSMRMLTAALVTALVTGLVPGAMGATGAPAPKSPKSRVVLRTPITVADPTQQITVTGKVPRAERGTKIKLQRRDGRSWRTVASGRTKRAGRFAITFVPTAGSFAYRASAKKARPSKPIVVVGRRVTTVALRARDSDLVVGSTAELIGSVTPAGARTVRLERRAGAGSWQSLGTRRTTAAGAFAFDDLPAVGAWSYRATTAATPTYAAGRSGEVAVLVDEVPRAAASLSIEVVGLPDGVPAEITATGPDGPVAISQTTTVAGAAPGEWSVSAEPVDVGTDGYHPSRPVATVTVGEGEDASVTVDYGIVVPETTATVTPSEIAEVTELEGGVTRILLADGAVARRTRETQVRAARSAVSRASSLCTGAQKVFCVGDIVAIGVTRDLPYGKLGRIPEGGVLANGFDLVPDGVTLTAALKEARSVERDLTVERQGQQQVTESLTCQEAASASIEGAFELTPSLDFVADWGLGGVRSVEVTARVDQTASLTASVSGSASCTLARTTVGERTLTPISFSIGPVPVVLVPRVGLYVDGAVEARAKISAGWHEELTGKIGMKWTPTEGVREVRSLTSDAGTDTTTFSGEAHAEIGLAPEVSVLMYGVAGPSLGLRASLGADASGTVGETGGRLDWTVTARARAYGRLDVPVLDVSSRELDLWSWEKELVRGNAAWEPTTPPPTITTTTLPGATAGLEYDVRLETEDDRNGTWSVAAGQLPAGLALVAGNGTITGTPLSAGSATFTVRFTDPQTRTDDQQLTLVVARGATGTTGTVSPDSDGYAHSASTSADGTVTAYVVSDFGSYSGKAAVHVAGRGAVLQPRPELQETFGSPMVSGDGHTLVVSHGFVPPGGQRTWEVLRMEPDGSDPSVVCRGDCSAGGVSRDGDRVVFATRTALVDADTDAELDAYLWDDGEVSLVSYGDPGRPAAGMAYGPAISANGRWVTFSSVDALTSDDPNDFTDAFRRDLDTGVLLRVSAGSEAVGGQAGDGVPADDGSVAFLRWGTLGYFYDAVTGTTARIPDRYARGGQYGYTSGLDITPDGQHVAYAYSVLYEDPQLFDVFVWDRATDDLNLVSWPETARPGASGPSITDDGDTVFYSSRTNESYPGTSQVLRWHRTVG